MIAIVPPAEPPAAGAPDAGPGAAVLPPPPPQAAVLSATAPASSGTNTLLWSFRRMAMIFLPGGPNTFGRRCGSVVRPVEKSRGGGSAARSLTAAARGGPGG